MAEHASSILPASDPRQYLQPKEGHRMTEPDQGIALLLRAVAFAAEKHRHQRRKDADASPYINHPIALANVLANEGGVTDIVVLCAAVLHDTIEDTDTTAEELRLTFGPEITSIVQEVTDDKSLEKHVRKQLQIEHAPYLSKEAKLVKLADKICNLKDLGASPPADWPATRKIEYVDWAGKVADGLFGMNASLDTLLKRLLTHQPSLVTKSM